MLCVAHIIQLIKFRFSWCVTQEQRIARNFTESSLEFKLDLLFPASPGGSSPPCFWPLSQTLAHKSETVPAPVPTCFCLEAPFLPLLLPAKVNSKMILN